MSISNNLLGINRIDFKSDKASIGNVRVKIIEKS
jgi:hypothetical protein